jgi:hypothetical protein
VLEPACYESARAQDEVRARGPSLDGPPGAGSLFRPDREGTHDEQSWRRRLPAALDFVCH